MLSYKSVSTAALILVTLQLVHAENNSQENISDNGLEAATQSQAPITDLESNEILPGPAKIDLGDEARIPVGGKVRLKNKYELAAYCTQVDANNPNLCLELAVFKRNLKSGKSNAEEIKYLVTHADQKAAKAALEEIAREHYDKRFEKKYDSPIDNQLWREATKRSKYIYHVATDPQVTVEVKAAALTIDTPLVILFSYWGTALNVFMSPYYLSMYVYHKAVNTGREGTVRNIAEQLFDIERVGQVKTLRYNRGNRDAVKVFLRSIRK